MGKKHNRDLTASRFADGSAWRQLQPLIEALPLAMLLVSPHGVPLFGNRCFGSRFGQPPTTNWLDLLGHSERTAAEVLWLTAGLERAPREAELSIHTSEGLVEMRCSIAPIEDGIGLPVWAIAFSKEKSDQAAELQRLVATAAETEAELARMAGQQEELLAHLRKSEAQRQEAESRLEASGAQLAQVSGRLWALEKRLESGTLLLRDSEAGRQELHGLLEMSRAHSAQAEAQLDQAVAQGRQLEELLLTSDAHRQTVAARLSDLEAHLAISEARFAEAENQLAQAVGRCQELEALLEDKQTQLAQATTRIHGLAGFLESSNTHYGEIEAQRHETTAWLSETEERLARSEAQLAQAEAQQQEAVVRLSQLGALLEDSNARLAESEFQRAETLARTQEVQLLLERSEEQRHELEQLLASSNVRVVESEGHRLRAEEQRAQSEAQLAQAVAQRQSIQRLLERSEAELAQTRAQLRKHEEKYVSFSAEAHSKPRQTEALGVQTTDMTASPRSIQDEFLMLGASRHREAEASLPDDMAEERTTGETSLLLLENPLSTSGTFGEIEASTERPAAGPIRDELDQLSNRLRSRVLREAFARWRVERSAGPVLHSNEWEELFLGATGYVVVEVDEAGAAVRVLKAQPLDDSPLMRALAVPLGSDGHSWQRCAITGQPAHHYVRVGLGSGAIQSLERLLMPFSMGGDRIDRLVLLMDAVDVEASEGHMVV